MNRREWWGFGLVATLLIANGVAAVARFQVNALFGDQWSFYAPLFAGADWGELFTWQHGPHRQGLAFVLTAVVLEWSHWDARWESLWIFAQLVAATGLAVNLKRRIVGCIRFTDIWIVVAGLSLLAYETILLVPNASHSVFPLLGLLAAANLWPEQMTVRRGIVLGVLAVVLAFTGFGLFGAAGLTVLLGMSAAFPRWAADRKERWAAGVGLGMGLCGWLCFAWGYQFAPASDGYRFPHDSMGEYVRFSVLMLAGRMGFDGASAGAYLAGAAVLGAGVIGVVVAVRRWRSEDDRRWSGVVVLLVGSTLAFVGFTAVGRVHLGVAAGMASRYMPLLLPLWLGVDLWAGRIGGRRLRCGVTAGALLMALGPWGYLVQRPVVDWIGTVGLRDGDLGNLRSFQRMKMAWVDAFEQSGDWRVAEAQVPDGVFPFTETLEMDARIEVLRERGLSFLSESDRALAWLSWWPDRSVQWLRPLGGASEDLTGRGLVRSRCPAWLNVRVRGSAAAGGEVQWAWAGKRGVMPLVAMRDGVSFAVSRGDHVMEVSRLALPAEEALRGAELSVSSEAEYPIWTWVKEGYGWSPLRRLVFSEGFYGWEEQGAFGWSAAVLEAEISAVEPTWLNLRVDSRFGPVDEGPLRLGYGEGVWSVSLAQAQGGISIQVLADGVSRILRVENPAGAMSPQAAGKWADARPLALRISRLSVDPQPAYGSVATMKANDRTKSP